MATTTSSTTSASSALVTALGGGTGIDMASLAETLAAAQFAAKTDRLTSQSDKLDKEISSASSIKSMLVNLSSSLGDRIRTGDLSPAPTIADSSVASGSLSGTARPKGSFSLEVTALARAQTLISPALPASTSTVGSGTLTLRFGNTTAGSFTEDTTHTAVPVTIAAGATLADVATAINAAAAGVTAYVAQTTSGAQLVLKGQSGAKNGFVLEAAETPGDPGLANLAWTAGSDATRLKATSADAAYSIDGLQMTASSNTITDAIPGLNLSLAGTNTGSPTTITFSDPATAITTAMQDFISALNEVAGALKSAVDPQTGDLSQDSAARSLQRKLAQFGSSVIMPNALGTEPKTLAEIGLATQRDGTFKLDTSRLTAALKADPNGVSAMFTNGLYGVYASFDALSRSATSTTDPGSLGGSITRYTKLKSKISESKAALEAKQEAMRTQLVSRFAKMNTNVNNSKSTLTYLQNQITAWNNSKN